MADRDRPQPHQIQVHPQFGKPHHQQQRQGPSVTKILTVMSLLPIGGTLLTLAGLTFAGTVTGLAVCTPLFILFSPVLVPAAIVIGLAVTGILTSGACGLTGISSLSWMLNYLRSGRASEQAKRRMQDVTGYVGQKTKEAGQTIQSKAQEGQGGRT